MIKIQQGGIIRVANKTLYGSVARGLPTNAMCVRWTLEYGGNFNNWKLEGYDLGKGYGISENMEREKHNVFGIYLVGFCDTQRDSRWNWRCQGQNQNDFIFCREVLESTGQYQFQIFRENF